VAGKLTVPAPDLSGVSPAAGAARAPTNPGLDRRDGLAAAFEGRPAIVLAKGLKALSRELLEAGEADPVPE